VVSFLRNLYGRRHTFFKKTGAFSNTFTPPAFGVRVSLPMKPITFLFRAAIIFSLPRTYSPPLLAYNHISLEAAPSISPRRASSRRASACLSIGLIRRSASSQLLPSFSSSTQRRTGSNSPPVPLRMRSFLRGCCFLFFFFFHLTRSGAPPPPIRSYVKEVLPLVL